MEYVLNMLRNPDSDELKWYMNQYSQEDRQFFDEMASRLPLSHLGSLGPHSVGAIREICKICNPKVILEIGFNVGYSSTMWLSFSEAIVYSVDNSDREHTFEAAERVKTRFGDRFHFLNIDSGEVQPLLDNVDVHFDFAFVDGDHTAPGVSRDLTLVKNLGVRNIAMDDYWPMFSAAQDVIPGSGYRVVKQWGNIVLCGS